MIRFVRADLAGAPSRNIDRLARLEQETARAKEGLSKDEARNLQGRSYYVSGESH